MGDVSRQPDSESELQQFDKLFPELVEDVLNSRAIKGAGTEQAVDWFRKVSSFFLYSDLTVRTMRLI